MTYYALLAYAVVVAVIAQVAPDITWVERAGVIGLLLAAVFAFLRGWIHTDREFRAMERRAEAYEAALLDALKAAGHSSQTAYELVQQSDPRRVTNRGEPR